jgi:uncharacterized membrane protein YfcA
MDSTLLNHPLFLISFGVFVGIFAGLMGLGGGSVMIPIMVLAFGMSQTAAHGTSLAAMIPPVTLPAVIKYAKEGNVDFRFAAWMALGMIFGTFFGAALANKLPKDQLKLVFGFILVYVAGYTIFSYFGSQHVSRSAFLAAVLGIVAVGMFLTVKWMDGPAPQTESTLPLSPR